MRLWENVTPADNLFYTLSFVILAFYCYFIQNLIHKWQSLVLRHGKKRGSVLYWSEFSTWLQLANICFFFAGMGCSLYAVQLIPPSIDIASDAFIDFGSVLIISHSVVHLFGLCFDFQACRAIYERGHSRESCQRIHQLDYVDFSALILARIWSHDDDAVSGVPSHKGLLNHLRHRVFQFRTGIILSDFYEY